MNAFPLIGSRQAFLRRREIDIQKAKMLHLNCVICTPKQIPVDEEKCCMLWWSGHRGDVDPGHVDTEILEDPCFCGSYRLTRLAHLG